MSPKKQYQKRLPTVLPPTPPRPRTSAERTDPTPTPVPVRRVPTVRSTVRVVPRPAPRPQKTRRSLRLPWRPALLAVLGLAVLVAGALLVRSLVAVGEEEPAARSTTTPEAAGAPRALAQGESYVESEVLADGDVMVHQWINADRPLQRIRLVLPDVPSQEPLSALDVRVSAGGTVVDGPRRIAGDGATFTFFPTSDVQVQYTLRGAVDRSASTPGRALAVATTLDLEYAPRSGSETRVVRSPGVVRTLACASSPEESPSPCGVADGRQWQVDLDGERVTDRVVAQVDVPGPTSG